MFELTKRNYHPLSRFSKDFNTLTRDVEEMFHFSGFPTIKGLDQPNHIPSLEMIEEKDQYFINTEIPGVEKDNISINLNDNILIIKGEKKEKIEKIDENTEIYYSEISYGNFRREIQIPNNVDKLKIDATYNDGVLKISLPKLQKKEPKIKKIDIK